MQGDSIRLQAVWASTAEGDGARGGAGGQRGAAEAKVAEATAADVPDAIPLPMPQPDGHPEPLNNKQFHASGLLSLWV